jgi:hypothetical protein
MSDTSIKRLGLILTIQSQLDAMKLENERWRMSGMVPKWNEKEMLKYTSLLAEATQIDNHGVERMAFEIKQILEDLNDN